MALQKWLDDVFSKKTTVTPVNVPRHFTALPCGCRRMSEEMVGASGMGEIPAWHVGINGDGNYVHADKMCGEVLDFAHPKKPRPLGGAQTDTPTVSC